MVVEEAAKSKKKKLATKSALNSIEALEMLKKKMSVLKLTNLNYKIHSARVTYWRLTSIKNALGNHAQSSHVEENPTGPNAQVTLSLPHSAVTHDSDETKDDDLTFSQNQLSSDKIDKH